MTRERLLARVREIAASPIPLPAAGHTPERLRILFDYGREDLSVARLAEAHFDALAILAEAGRPAAPGALYGVWAAETPDEWLGLEGNLLSGTKPFCSGAGLIDRALVTVKLPEPVLLEVRLKDAPQSVPTVAFDMGKWKSSAFRDTNTASVTFKNYPVLLEDIVGDAGFYLSRPGFWHGACGPAACWAGGAAGLVAWALEQRKREDPHTLAHLGAMRAAVWAMQAALDAAGRQIDASPVDAEAAQHRALALRHTLEQSSTDILRRLARAFGPHPMAFDETISRRYQELDLYLRQCHAERDLEALGRGLRSKDTMA